MATARINKTAGAVTKYKSFLGGAAQPAANILSKLSTNVRNLQGTVDQTVKEISKEEAAAFKNELILRINEIPDNVDVQSAGEGGANDKGAVSYKTNKTGYTVVWSGPQVEYLEYGTGDVGKGSYPGQVPYGYNYHSFDHANGDSWVFEDEQIGHSVWSSGWYAYAPMYNTSLHWRYNGAMTASSKAKLERKLTRKIKEGL